MIVEGLKLMLIGMGTVFLFLNLLYLAIAISGRLVLKYLPEPPPELLATKKAKPVGSVDADVIAAISAAISQYRARKK